MNGFAYWEGHKPPFISLCHELLMWKNQAFQIYTEDQLRNDELPWMYAYAKDDLFWRLEPAHRADIFRVKTLEAQGGFWIDSDFICLNSLSPLLNVSIKYDKFMYYADSWGPTNGILIAPPNHTLISEWSRKIDAVFAGFKRTDSIPTRDQWTIFGADQMRVLLPIAIQPVQELGWDRVQLISFQNREQLFDNQDVKNKAWLACYGYMLFNKSGIPDWFRNLSTQEIMEGPWLISELFRIAKANQHNSFIAGL